MLHFRRCQRVVETMRRSLNICVCSVDGKAISNSSRSRIEYERNDDDDDDADDNVIHIIYMSLNGSGSSFNISFKDKH